MMVTQTAQPEVVRKMINDTVPKAMTFEEQRTLNHYLTFSSTLCIGTNEDRLICAWGLIPPSLMAEEALLWMYSTDEIDNNQFLFVRNSQRAIENALKEFSVIKGYTDPASSRSVRWLKWLGAEFGEPIGKHMPFTIRKK